MLSVFMYLACKSLNQREFCSAGSDSLHIHFVMRAILRNLVLMTPSPPGPLAGTLPVNKLLNFEQFIGSFRLS
jgi:hypothetical protein